MKWLFAFGGLLVGLFFGYVGRDLLTLQFKREFDIADILGIVLTLVIAFLVQNYLTVRFSASRVERDLAIEQARSFLEAAREIRRSVEASHRKGTLTNADFHLLTAETKKLGIALSALEDTVGIFFSDKHDSELRQIQTHFFAYRQVLTGKPVNEAYSPSNISAEQQAHRLLTNGVVRLIRKINLR